MTSKESLEQIKRDGVFLNSNGEIDSKRTCECFSDYCNKINQDLERLEHLEKENQELKEQHEKDFEIICKQAYLLNNKHIDRPFIEKYQKFIDFLKLNFDISLDSKLRISDGSECVQTFIIDLPENTTIDEMFEIIEEVLGE